MAILQHSAFLGVLQGIWGEGANYVIRKLFLAAYAEWTQGVLLVLLCHKNLSILMTLTE